MLCYSRSGKDHCKGCGAPHLCSELFDSSSEWRYKEASSWSAEVQDRELYYLQQNIKDGDYIVIDNDVENNALALKVSVRLGNLTFKNTVGVPVVYANGYDSVYFLSGTSGAVNGDVSHAYVYGDAKANFNSNVDTLEMIGLTDDKPIIRMPPSTVSVPSII